MKDKKDIIFQGTATTYSYNYQKQVFDDILYYIKEKGLTISQAIEVLTDLIKALPDYGMLITAADYEKITGKDPFSKIDS